MEVLRFDPSDKKLKFTKLPIPKVEKATDVLIKVKSSGLCGTDLKIMKGKFSNASKETVTLGHEVSGVVVDSGAIAQERGFAKGKRVGIDPHGHCHECYWCHRGKVNYCCGGPQGLRPSIGIRLDGGLAEYLLCPAEFCHLIQDDIDFDMGVLCEPLACIMHGWNRLNKFAPPQPDSKIFVLGAGIIGNLWTCMFHYHGYKDVTITEPIAKRREIVRNLTKGSGFKVMSPDEAMAVMPKNPKEAELKGVDIAVDCTGNAKAFEQVIPWMRRGGAICVFGCTPPNDTATIHPEQMFAKELIIFGTQIDPFFYSRAISMAQGMGSQYLNCQRLGIECFKLSEYATALEKLSEGSISKAMFRF